MINIAVVGTGTMGRLVRDMAEKSHETDKVWAIEPALGETLWDIKEKEGGLHTPDVVIDFSNPEAFDMIARYILAQKGMTALVTGTTGFPRSADEKFAELAQVTAVLKSSNFSHGISALKKITALAADLLAEDSDIEIIEKHHNHKNDSPSGTAVMLADIIDPDKSRERICGRQGDMKRRREIGMHSIRGGTIFGEHTVIFAMNDELIEIKHTAFSRYIFAKGALEAAYRIKGMNPGLYTTEDILY